MKHEHHLELKGRMRAKCVTIETIAQKCKTSPLYVSRRLTCRYPWTLDMILDICALCDIATSDIPTYFERSDNA